jgi:hypothetical protein
MKRLISPLLAAVILSPLVIGTGCEDSDPVPQAVLEQASSLRKTPYVPPRRRTC